MSSSDDGVVTFGEVMALFLAAPGRSLRTADGFALGFAGAEATVAVGLARLGRPAAYFGRLGDDPLGARTRDSLEELGVDVSDLALVAGEPTGLIVRDAAGDGPVTVQYARRGSAATSLAPADVPVERIRRAAVLHVSGITAVLSESARAAARHAVTVAKQAGVPVTFDPNVRLKLAPPAVWADVVTEFAGLADVVLTGADDARVVTAGDPAEWFLARGAERVVVKDGVRGSSETDATGATRQPAIAVTAADPVGAGDAFAAGWIHGWLGGLGVAGRLRTAAAVAALCVGSRGDVAGLPDAAALAAFLARSHELVPGPHPTAHVDR